MDRKKEEERRMKEEVEAAIAKERIAALATVALALQASGYCRDCAAICPKTSSGKRPQCSSNVTLCIF
jgi:hypothetical protein